MTAFRRYAGKCSGCARGILDQSQLTEDAARADTLENLSERDDVDGAAAHDIHRRAGLVLEEDALAGIEAAQWYAATREHAEIEIGVGHCPQCLACLYADSLTQRRDWQQADRK